MSLTPACPTLSVEQFQATVATLDVPLKLSPPRYARRKILAAAGDACPLCHVPFDRVHPKSFTAPVIASVLHTFLGGPLTVDNLFVCCRACQQSRRSADLLTVAALPDHLADQRTVVLLMSQNHLVPLPKSATLTDVRAALGTRHIHPRSRVYAAQCDDGTCMLGVSRRYGDRQSKGLVHLLGKLSGSTLFRNSRLSVYRLADEDFRRVVWDLIDANAWVVGVGRRSVGRDFRDHWWVSSASVGELRNRRVAGIRVPVAQDSRVVGERALRWRRQRDRECVAQELREAEAALAQAEAALDAFFAARRSPTGFPTAVSEGQRLSQVRLAASQRWLAARELAGQAAAE